MVRLSSECSAGNRMVGSSEGCCYGNLVAVPLDCRKQRIFSDLSVYKYFSEVPLIF